MSLLNTTFLLFQPWLWKLLELSWYFFQVLVPPYYQLAESLNLFLWKLLHRIFFLDILVSKSVRLTISVSSSVNFVFSIVDNFILLILTTTWFWWLYLRRINFGDKLESQETCLQAWVPLMIALIFSLRRIEFWYTFPLWLCYAFIAIFNVFILSITSNIAGLCSAGLVNSIYFAFSTCSLLGSIPLSDMIRPDFFKNLLNHIYNF